jgi:hypothetical protein
MTIANEEVYMEGISRRAVTAAGFALALGVGAATPAKAQGQGWDLLPPGAAFLGIGASGIGTGNLDDRLAARGFPTFGTSALALSLGAYGILPGGLTVGAEWHGLVIGDGTHEGREVGLGGGYGTLGLGYMVELSPLARIHPRIGLGAGGMGLWLESDTGTVDFNAALDGAQSAPVLREPVLSRNSVVVDLGVGAELLPGGWGRGLMLGVRVGYLAAPFTSSWQLHDQQVSGGPAASLGGPYIRAMFGIGKGR